MTKSEAHVLLDSARSGAEVEFVAITAALRVTGDIDEDWPAQQIRVVGSWERHLPGVLAKAGPFDGLIA